MHDLALPPRTSGAPLLVDLASWLAAARRDARLIYRLTPDDLTHRIGVHSAHGSCLRPMGITKVRRFAQYDTAATTRTWLKALVTACTDRKQYVWPALRKMRLLTVIDHLGTGILHLYHQEGRASFQVVASSVLPATTWRALHEGMLVYFPDLSPPPKQKPEEQQQ